MDSEQYTLVNEFKTYVLSKEDTKQLSDFSIYLHPEDEELTVRSLIHSMKFNTTKSAAHAIKLGYDLFMEKHLRVEFKEAINMFMHLGMLPSGLGHSFYRYVSEGDLSSVNLLYDWMDMMTISYPGDHSYVKVSINNDIGKLIELDVMGNRNFKDHVDWIFPNKLRADVFHNIAMIYHKLGSLNNFSFDLILENTYFDFDQEVLEELRRNYLGLHTFSVDEVSLDENELPMYDYNFTKSLFENHNLLEDDVDDEDSDFDTASNSF